MVEEFKRIVQSGEERPENLYISGMAPHDKGTIQGEVIQSDIGLRLLYCDARKPMREAMAEGSVEVIGVEAVALLREYMCPASYDWLQELLDRYPGHVIEFSCFRIGWGTWPSYNTVFWEVRAY